MRTYSVKCVDTDERVPLTGDVDGTIWSDAAVAQMDQFAWSDRPGPETTVRALHDGHAVYLQFHAEDDAITADVTELNGPTFKDSSVEFFAAPAGDGGKYLNFEANCCGTFKLGWQEPNWRDRGVGRDLISSRLAGEIDISTSVPSLTKAATSDDDFWWLAARLPLETLRSFTGRPLCVDGATTWRGNFYRSGVPDAKKGTWNRIDLPEPAYHSPEYFGRITFE